MNESNTIAQIVVEINRLSGGTLKATAFKSKALALARFEKLRSKNSDMYSAPYCDCLSCEVTESKTAEKEPKKVAKKASKKVKAVPAPMIPRTLIATLDEVQELQVIRDLRLAGSSYMDRKIKFFNKFRAKYGITTTNRIKIETEDVASLGVVQYCGSNLPVTLGGRI